MNQNSAFPPILPPSTELGALLFAVLPCLQEAYRPFASFAYHMTELSKIKTFPSVPSLTNLRSVEALISDKDTLFQSLSYYGNLFHMPLLSTVASLLQAMQFYNAYKDILPGIFSAVNGNENSSSFDSMAGLFSGLGGLSPDILSSLFSGFSGNISNDRPFTHTEQKEKNKESNSCHENASKTSPSETPLENTDENSFDLYDSLSAFLTPEQKEIYETLMNTD